MFRHRLPLAIGFLAVACGLSASPAEASRKLRFAAKSPVRRVAAARPVVDETTRLAQAKELLGKHYRKSAVKLGETVGAGAKLDARTIRAWTRDSLPKKHRARSRAIADAILREASRYEFDPVFLMAVIQNESSFNPDARGRDGEWGLMQLMPDTAAWIARKSGIAFKRERALRDPVLNIRIGAAYLSFLRGRFDNHGRLYLAAYNMGPTNVHRALDRQVWPRKYAQAVMQRYVGYYERMRSVAPVGGAVRPETVARIAAASVPRGSLKRDVARRSESLARRAKAAAPGTAVASLAELELAETAAVETPLEMAAPLPDAFDTSEALAIGPDTFVDAAPAQN